MGLSDVGTPGEGGLKLVEPVGGLGCGLLESVRWAAMGVVAAFLPGLPVTQLDGSGGEAISADALFLICIPVTYAHATLINRTYTATNTQAQWRSTAKSLMGYGELIGTSPTIKGQISSRALARALRDRRRRATSVSAVRAAAETALRTVLRLAAPRNHFGGKRRVWGGQLSVQHTRA